MHPAPPSSTAPAWARASFPSPARTRERRPWWARGQVLRVRFRQPLERWLLALPDEKHPVYVIKRDEDWVLGGTYEEGAEDDLSTPRAGDPRLPDEERIIDECMRLAGLGDRSSFEVVSRGAGLRPVRTGGIWLDIETDADGGRIIHNYGHGGAGFTVSWGCAAEVARLALGVEDAVAG